MEMQQLATGFGFLEAPAWDESEQCLLFADPALGGIWRLAADGTVDCPYPHRRGVGGMAIHADGGIVIAGKTLAWKRGEETYRFADAPPGLTRFNDLTTDPEGRVYVGSIDMEPEGTDNPRTPGFLHRVDLDGTVTELFGGYQVTNGMKVSRDGTLLYHGDTGHRTVWVYDRAPDGSLSERRPFIAWDDAGPDGMAMASDGTLFVVLVRGGKGQIAVVSPEGAELDRIQVPGPATSCCFGGQDLRTLYVVTGSAVDGSRRDASIFATELPMAGHPVPLARIRPPAQ
ncbi:MAG: SMP-30/gluconolactonase/LRE family protein [Dehalococcoidia bacterium]|nr:SMP-30/gluconolactonase/LRE family protein [Dehalococcoidia bacterium]